MARTPHLTAAFYSPGDPMKNGFYLGGIGRHLEKIWVFENWLLGAIWPTFDLLTAFDSGTSALTILKIS